MEDHTPNEALKDEAVRIEVLHTNMNKSKKNSMMNNDLSVGDHVRVSETNYFKKGTEPRWSDEIFTVEGIKGMSVTLNDDKVYKRDKLLRIPKDTIKITQEIVKPNVIKQATKEKKREILHKQVGVDEANMISNKRQSKKREILDL